VPGKVFLPGTTPRQKRDRIAVLGGEDVEVLLVGDTYDDAAAAALADAARTGATLVPRLRRPAHDRRPGTVVAEAFAQLGQVPDVVVLPVGGGGLLRRRAELAGGAPPGGCASSASSLPGRPAWPRRCRPASRCGWRRSTASSTAPPCAAPAT
jgi:threonine dehydratase